MKFFGRDGGELADAGAIKTNAINQWDPCTIYGIDGVIDVLLVTWNKTAMSVNPKAFKRYADVIGTAASTNNIDGTNLWCNYNIKVPIDTYKFNKKANDLAADLKSAITSYNAAWGENDNSKLVKGADIDSRSDIYKTLMTNHPKNSPAWFQLSKFTGCTSFNVLFGDVETYSVLMREGYHFFNPNFVHRSNWLRFESNSNDHDSYYMVMFMTIPMLMLERNLIKAADGRIEVNTLRDRAKDDIASRTLIQSVCQSGPQSEPDFFIWSQGDYYMGASLYCVTGDYKLVVQGDGNVVLYQINDSYQWSAKWASGTYGAQYARPKFTIEGNGKISVSGTVTPQSNGPSTHVITDATTSNGAYLYISPTGELLLKEKSTGKTLWGMNPDPSANNYVKYTNYFEPGFRFEPGNYPVKSAIYSPNLVYSLQFQADGNLVLAHLLENRAIWHSGTSGLGAVKLSIQSDGNVVIFTNTAPIWSTGTANWNTTMHLAIDNTGVVILLAKVGDFWTLAWSSQQTSWKALFAGSGMYYKQRSPYATVTANRVKPKALDEVVSSSALCTSTAFKSIPDSGIQLSARIDYCTKDYNILLDQQACKPFFERTIPGDDSNGSKKTRMDNYVTGLCDPGSFSTRFSYQPGVQTLLNDFCACISPLGVSGEIMKKVTGQSVSPACFDTSCINDGYKTKAIIDTPCPKCMCTSVVNANNSTLTNVNQTCAAGCVDLSGGKAAEPEKAKTEPKQDTQKASPPTNGDTQKASLPTNTKDSVDIDIKNKKTEDVNPPETKSWAAEHKTALIIIGVVVGVVFFLLVVLLLRNGEGPSPAYRAHSQHGRPTHNRSRHSRHYQRY